MDIATGMKIGLLVMGVLLLILYSRMGKLLRCMLFTAATGLASMGLIWLLGKAFVIGVSITPFSLLTAVVLGLPGVLGMLLMYLI